MKKSGKRKFSKKSIVILLAVVFIFPLPGGLAFADAKFSDTKGHWAENTINKWSESGLIVGDNGKFRPNDSITRAEMATICSNMLGLENKAENTFGDLKSDVWYTDAVLKCVAADIIKGDGKAVRPNDNITREEAAVVIGRALQMQESQKGAEAFKDYGKISAWALGYVNTMAANNYIKGYEGNFNPASDITRAEVITIIDNTGYNQTADKVLKSTYIYTVASETPVSGGVAVKDGKILAVGSMADIEKYIDKDTEVVDYGDKMIMPGFVDGHTHTGVAETVVGVDLTFIDDRNLATERVKAYLKANPDAKVVVGGGWYAAVWGGEDPDKSYLDAATTDIPVIIWDFDHHCNWVNSKALELAGIDAAFAKEFNEKAGNIQIVVDKDGNPTGYLQEGACKLMDSLMPQYSEKDLKYCIDIWSQYGVTAVNEMSEFHKFGDPVFSQLEALRDSGELNVRQILSINCETTDEQLNNMVERFNKDSDDMINFGGLKIMIDGVGSTYNASMLQPYVDTVTCGPEVYYSVDQLSQYIQKAARHDLVTHFHVCGDKAVRTALDAYQNAADKGVKLNKGFSIDHCDTTAAADVARPAKLGISCNLTPDFLAATETWETNPYLMVYDSETAKELWRCKSFIDSGANVAFGTDAYCSSYSPFVQMYRAMYRVTNDGKPDGGYLPAEKIDIKQAIYCYTMGSATSCRMEDKIGSLETGKYADIIVLDTNIINCTPDQLFKAGVDVTYVNGKVVYQK